MLPTGLAARGVRRAWPVEASFGPRRWRKPFAEDGDILAFVPKRSVKGGCGLIAFTYHELHLWRAAGRQPELHLGHHLASMTASLPLRTDSQVIDPAAMAVMTGHDTGDDHVIHRADEDRGIA